MTTDDRTSRFHRLIKGLQSIKRECPRSYVDKLPNEVLYFVFHPSHSILRYINFEFQSGWSLLDLNMVCGSALDRFHPPLCKSSGITLDVR